MDLAEDVNGEDRESVDAASDGNALKTIPTAAIEICPPLSELVRILESGIDSTYGGGGEARGRSEGEE